MSPFLDVHSVAGGISPAESVEAHEASLNEVALDDAGLIEAGWDKANLNEARLDEAGLEAQDSYGVSYLRHWANESLRRLGPRHGRSSRLRRLLMSRLVDEQRRGFRS